jgi:hypothetical protein
MKELDERYFCSVTPNYIDSNDTGEPVECPAARNECPGCANYHRKWPTPEQFEQEYGHTADGMLAWRRTWVAGAMLMSGEKKPDSFGEWEIEEYSDTTDYYGYQVLIACTPYGKPPASWRPE